MRLTSSAKTGCSLSHSAICLSLAAIGRRVATFGLGVVIVGLLASCAYATVETHPEDDVIPSDNGLSSANEGLPTTGHSIQWFRLYSQPPNPNTFFNVAYQEDFVDGNGFEGRYDVVVGKSGSGTVVISSPSQIRAEHLIIGDSAGPPLTVFPYRDFNDGQLSQAPNAEDLNPLVEGNQTYTGVRGADLLGDGTGARGSGTVRIDGVSSLYNNAWRILPPSLSPPVVEDFGSTRQPDSDTKVGFDAYIGRYGSGRLEITAGGRAEIEDAVIVGDWGGSNGVLLVDGIQSSLSNGGFEAPPATTGIGDDTVHFFSVGRFGLGTVNITTGGQIYSIAPTSSTGTQDTVTAAVIGGDDYDSTGHSAPEAGGTGTVIVDGTGSTWTVAGNLQVGGFHDSVQGAAPDVEGDNVAYESNVGQGTLTVSNGGIINIVPPPLETSTSRSVDQLLLVVGRRGTVNLAGGQIELQAGTDPNQTTTPTPLVDDVQIINDGVIKGSGSIITGSFDNRYYGRISVGAGQSLTINAYTPNVAPNQPLPMVNYGLIEVIGTEEVPAELDLSWQPSADTGLIVPFINRPVATTLVLAPGSFDGGLISAQWATLRFSSGHIDDPEAPELVDPPGMRNEGVMAFTAGMNIIQGYVRNAQDPDADPGNPPLVPRFLIGPNTTVVVEDDFDVQPPAILDLSAGAQLIILDQNTLTLAGVLNIELDASGSIPIIASGDVALGGVLNASLSNDLLGSLAHGSTFEFLSFGGEAYHVDTSGVVAVPDFDRPLEEGLHGFGLEVHTNADALFPALDPIAHLFGGAIYLSFLNPSMVGPFGAIGADFNGDGIVDDDDLAVWRANFGITSGASILQGDADGDGDVDGNDFLLLQLQFGGPPTPGAGAGAGAMALGSNVPEPTSGVLLLSGAVLALTAVRRRRRAS